MGPGTVTYVDEANDPLVKGRSTNSIEDDFMYGTNVANSHVYIRMGFLRKVYGILAAQLVLSTIIAATFRLTPPIREFVTNNPWMVILALFLSIGLLIALHFKRHETPLNFVLLTGFTVTEAYTLGVIVTFYDQMVVLQAFVLTAAVVVALTAYTLQSKRDFSKWGSFLFAALVVLIIAGIMQIFIMSRVLDLVLSIFGALLFSLFVVYDTHVIMHKMSAEEYILATITLYLDIINLFLEILKILDAINKNR